MGNESIVSLWRKQLFFQNAQNAGAVFPPTGCSSPHFKGAHFVRHDLITYIVYLKNVIFRIYVKLPKSIHQYICSILSCHDITMSVPHFCGQNKDIPHVTRMLPVYYGNRVGSRVGNLNPSCIWHLLCLLVVRRDFWMRSMRSTAARYLGIAGIPIEAGPWWSCVMDMT